MVTFVCWKWTDARNGRRFESEYVNVLGRALKRNCKRPHRLVCVTDDPAGLDPSIEHFPMPVTGFEHLINPSERVSHKPFPSCYRRLWNFSEAAGVFGELIFSLDIDVIVTAPLDPLLDHEATFVGWCDARFGWSKVAGGAYLLRTGAHREVWEQFDPELSPAIAKAAGNGGSDQAWMSYKLYPPPAHWSSRDGVVKLKWLPARAPRCPPGVRLVFTSGEHPPWKPDVQTLYPWIREHWY